VRQLLGLVYVRSPENFREEVGMNLMCESRQDRSPLCAPAYSWKASPESPWLFSDLTLAALKEYKAKFPGLMGALARRHDIWQDLQARELFPGIRRVDWSFKQLLKYIAGQPYKKLRLAPAEHQAMTPHAVLAAAALLDQAQERVAGRSAPCQQVCGERRFYGERLYRAEDSGSRPPLRLFGNEPLCPGQRGVYVAARGTVPWGACGVVIGVYGVEEPEVELLLDEERFGASDLCGRAPPCRGIRVPMKAVLPLKPWCASIAATGPAPAEFAVLRRGEEPVGRPSEVPRAAPKEPGDTRIIAEPRHAAHRRPTAQRDGPAASRSLETEVHLGSQRAMAGQSLRPVDIGLAAAVDEQISVADAEAPAEDSVPTARLLRSRTAFLSGNMAPH